MTSTFSWPLGGVERRLSIVGGEIQDSDAHVRRGGGFAIDIAASEGTPFYPVLPEGIPGYVREFAEDPECGLRIDYGFTWGDSLWRVRYCHSRALHPTNGLIGLEINATTLLGWVGHTGHADGPHIHLVMWRDGVRVRPEDWLLDVPSGSTNEYALPYSSASDGANETGDSRTPSMDSDRIVNALNVVWGWSEVLRLSISMSRTKKLQAEKELKDAVRAIKEEAGLE